MKLQEAQLLREQLQSSQQKKTANTVHEDYIQASLAQAVRKPPLSPRVACDPSAHYTARRALADSFDAVVGVEESCRVSAEVVLHNESSGDARTEKSWAHGLVVGARQDHDAEEEGKEDEGDEEEDVPMAVESVVLHHNVFQKTGTQHGDSQHAAPQTEHAGESRGRESSSVQALLAYQRTQHLRVHDSPENSSQVAMADTATAHKSSQGGSSHATPDCNAAPGHSSHSTSTQPTPITTPHGHHSQAAAGSEMHLTGRSGQPQPPSVSGLDSPRTLGLPQSPRRATSRVRSMAGKHQRRRTAPPESSLDFFSPGFHTLATALVCGPQPQDLNCLLVRFLRPQKQDI